MSELRDLTNTLRSFERRMTRIEDALLVLLRDSAQQSAWRHQQRNQAVIELEAVEGRDRAVRQVQEACGVIHSRLDALVERLDNQAATRLVDVTALNRRVGVLERNSPVRDEVTANERR